MSAYPCGRLQLARYLAEDFSLLIGVKMARYVMHRGTIYTLH